LELIVCHDYAPTDKIVLLTFVRMSRIDFYLNPTGSFGNMKPFPCVLRMAWRVRFSCLCIVLMLASWAGGADPSRQAEFTVTQVVGQASPPGFGAEYEQQQRINNWTNNPGMEPLRAEDYWEPSAVGADADGDYYVCDTTLWDTLRSGFYDGARIRIYREQTDSGTSNTVVNKIYEGTIPTGGYVAEAWMQIGLGAVSAQYPATDATDDYRIANGETWYYAVRAHDTSGNWSDYATASGATASASADNGPRIVTQRIENPTVGTAYTTDAPLATLTADGGTGTLTWAITAGSLPTGLSLNSSGQIIGTCTASTQSQFTVRVQDTASRNHTRQYILFRTAPAVVEGNPSAPTNVAVESNNGFLHLTWTASTSSDVDYYDVVRSHSSLSDQTTRIYVPSECPAIAAGDLVFVSLDTMNSPSASTRSLRILDIQSETSWNTASDWGIPESAITKTIMAHPGTIPVAMQDENPGEGCLRVASTGSGEFGIAQYTYGGTSDTWWGVYQLTPGRTYRMECWVYGVGMPGNTVHFQCGDVLNSTVTGLTNGSWTKVSSDFTVTDWLPDFTFVTPSIMFQGPGTVYIDNALLYCVDEASGPCGLAQDSLDLWKQYIGPTTATNKGVTRVRYHDTPFEHIVNPSVMSMRGWNLNYGGSSLDNLHLNEALQISYESGSTPGTRPIPWITANLRWSEEDWLHLFEFLSGPAGTTYGDMRIAQRGGVTTPWTDEFRSIYIEMSNESWNTGYFFGFRGGYGEDSARTYGRFCNYIWNYVKSNSPYWSTTGNKVGLILNGWSANFTETNYGIQAFSECPDALGIGYTSYLGGWERNDPVGGTVWSDAGVQQWSVYRDRSATSEIDPLVALESGMAAEGKPFRICMYEGGPSYLMDGLNGVSLTDDEQATSLKYGCTLAAAIGTLDYWLYESLVGVDEQAFFTFSQDQGLWCSHTPVHTGYRPHPAWQALELINNNVLNYGMLVASSQSMPTYDMMDTENPTEVYKSNIPLVSAYAFKNGNDFALCLINKKLDGVHDNASFGNGHTPATVHLPFTNPGSITLKRLVGDPRETNQDALNFGVETVPINTSVFNQNFVVGTNTGGVSDGMEMGVYLYLFENVTFGTLPTNPTADVEQAATQSDPQNGSTSNSVVFTVTFDRSVTGFDNPSSDLILSGTAAPQGATIEEVAGSQGVIYNVTVGPMLTAGTVTCSVPTGAAQAVEGGASSLASTSVDNRITIQFNSGMNLLEWEFLTYETDHLPNPDCTMHHAWLKPAKIEGGAGVTVETNRYYNIDAFSVTDVNSTSMNLDDYLTWSVAPATTDTAASLQNVHLGVFNVMADQVQPLALYFSTDNFATSTPIPLSPAPPIIGRGLGENDGTALDGELTGFPTLQDCDTTVTFRLYLWGTDAYWTASGIGKLGEATNDLVVTGMIGKGDSESTGTLTAKEWTRY
jgi:hypothetical protein